MKKILFFIYSLILGYALSYVMPAYSAESLYSLTAAEELLGRSSMKQGGIEKNRINLNISSAKILIKNAEVQISLPAGHTVTGIVKRTITEQSSFTRSSVDLKLKPSNEISTTIISFKGNAGALELTEEGDQIVSILLHDTIAGQIYRAEIDEYGQGEFKQEDLNDYLCVDHPLVEDDLPQAISFSDLVENIPSLDGLQNLESKPGASNTLYINYWGGTLSNTIWNNNYNSGNDIVYTPYSNDRDTSSFSARDKKLMWQGWREVVEDFASFDINITTSQAVFDAAAIVNRTQIIATRTNDFYPGAGGVAYVGIFHNGSEYSKTGFVWSSGLDGLGLATSHETGHQMGLSHDGTIAHDGTSARGYYSGHGQWGPIMGAPYGKKYVQWSRGDYAYGSQHQDDIAIIERVLGGIEDDAGDSMAAATPLAFPALEYQGQITPDGMSPDIDVYSFVLNKTHYVDINVASLLLSESENQGANLAFNVTLKNSQDKIIARMSSRDGARLTIHNNTFNYQGSLVAETYYLTIDGVSPDIDRASGFVEYGNGGQYRLSIKDAEYRNVVEETTGLSGVRADMYTDQFDVPEGASDIRITISDKDDNGDADLYVKFNDPVTRSVYDCYKTSSIDGGTCSGSESGTYNILIVAYDDYSNVTLRKSYKLKADGFIDQDNDGIADDKDSDRDGDGIDNDDDAFPDNKEESVDSDGDGLGNHADKDDDGDGIVDVQDSEPLNPSIGDDQAPIIADIPESTIEARGNKTQITLAAPKVEDNNLYPPTLVSDYRGPLTVGRHIITWLARDYAGNTSTKNQVIHIVDTTAPHIDNAEIIVINARGLMTNISANIKIQAEDLVDGKIQLKIIGDQVLPSGKHQLAVSAQDNAGNITRLDLDLAINPGVSIPREDQLAPGSLYRLAASLAGEAAVYPVTVGYQIDGDIVGKTSGQIVFAEGTEQFLDIEISSRAQNGDSIIVNLIRSDHAFIANPSLTLTVSDDNYPPQIELVMQQGGSKIKLIDPSLGIVTVKLELRDKNPEDSHNISWQASHSSIQDLAADSLNTSFEFDPEGLVGVYSLAVQVRENNTQQGLGASIRQSLIIASGQEEGVRGQNGDADGDGIVDGLDHDSSRSRLPIASDIAPLQTLAGLQLSLGDVVLMSFGTNSQYAAISMANLAEHGGERGMAAEHPQDIHFNAESSMVNYRISNLNTVAASVPVVIPLKHDEAITEKSLYRQFSTTESWSDFLSDANNTLSSAMSDEDGNCPVALSASYQQGLNLGDNCIQLMLEDGGINDQDHRVDGVITALGVLASETENHLPVIVLAKQFQGEEGTEIILDASATTDAENDPLTYHWQQMSGQTIALNNGADKLVLMLPKVTADETLMIKLIVDDGRGISAREIEVKITKTSEEPAADDRHSSTTSGGSLGWLILLFALLTITLRRQQ